MALPKTTPYTTAPPSPYPLTRAASSTPSPPDASLATANANAGEDRISRLPDELLSNIVARLPLKDAARTATISLRWRRVWASTPLVLYDADLFPVASNGGVVRWRTITDAISCILTAHQGPFLSIRLTYSFHYAVARDAALARRWLRVLADKGVESLQLFNHPGSTSTSLPSEVIGLALLGRLELEHWDFPSTDCLRRGGSVFPRLRELRLSEIRIRAADIDRILQYSPKLETFALISSDCSPPNVRIRSLSIQCVIFWMSVANMFHVIVAPNLKRLILWCKEPDGQPVHDSPIRLYIGHTPNLKVLGYLDPRIHMLEVGNTIIEAETRPTPGSVVPSVGIMALNVRFDVPKEAHMVPSFLGCFPFIHTLHVQSAGADEYIGEPSFKFWLETSTIGCLPSTLRKVMFKNFQGYDSELAFLRFIWERAKALQKLVVDFDGDDALIEEVVTKLKSQVCAKLVQKGRKSTIVLRSGGSKWSLSIASNLTLSDPFDF
ncbi:unnamed protein product [Urochloa humidicola]